MDKHIEDLLAKMMEGALASDDEARLEEAMRKDEDLRQLVEELKSHYELEAYLNNEQTIIEKENLESKLNQDSSLREKMEDIKMLHSFLDVAETHQIQQTLNQITRRKKKIKWFTIIGFSTFLIATLIWLFAPPSKTEDLPTKPQDSDARQENPPSKSPNKKDTIEQKQWPSPNLRAIADEYRAQEVEMGTRGGFLDSLNGLWLPLFRDKKYRELVDFIQPLDSTFYQLNNDQGLFALGYAQFRLKDYQSASKVLFRVSEMTPSLWTERARWYLVLSYIYLQDKENCILTLQRIKSMPDHYNYKQASHLLQKANSL